MNEWEEFDKITKGKGIICAALLVYGNMGREGKLEHSIPKELQISELMQIEYHNEKGKLEKFKPEIAEIMEKFKNETGKYPSCNSEIQIQTV